MAQSAIHPTPTFPLASQGAWIVMNMDGWAKRMLGRGVGVLLLLWAFSVSAQTVVTPSLQVCIAGNTADLSSNGCTCSSNLECMGVCPIAANGSPRVCTGGGDVPVCGPVGNLADISANGCPCNSNLDCEGVCPIPAAGMPRVCVGGPGPAGPPPPPCGAPGNGVNASQDGCPCDSAADCQGSCNTSTRTCGGLIGAVANRQIQFSALASGDVELGAAITQEATVANAYAAPSSVRFTLHPPQDLNCATVLYQSLRPLQGVGTVMAVPYVPPSTGTHRWVARYIGNAWNLPAASVCFDPNQSVPVFPSLFKNGFE